MTIETKIPYSWLRSAPSDIKAVDEIPLWGQPPVFPWGPFAEFLGKILQIKDLKILPSETMWKTKEEALAGLGLYPVISPFQVPPLTGKGYLMIAREGLKVLFNLSVGSLDDLPILQQEQFQKEFTEFLALESLLAFQMVKYDSSLRPEIAASSADLPIEGTCLCIDVCLQTPLEAVQVRIAFTQEMRQSIREKYAPKTLNYPAGFSEAVVLPLSIVAGHLSLTQKEWKSASLGDFLVLDYCSLPPNDEKGRVVITVNGTPLFRGKIKDGNIKLLEYPVLQEVQASMAKHTESEFEDEEFEAETEGSEESDDDFTEEEGFDDELTDEESVVEKKAPQAPSKEPASTKSLHGAAPAASTPLKPLLKPDEIPLILTVEVGRIQMSIQKLMSLEPGNVLDLDIHPEAGVDLVINGRLVGKGELLKLGETLGVRILDKA